MRSDEEQRRRNYSDHLEPCSGASKGRVQMAIVGGHFK
jgi:hypothetical protein